VKLGQLGTRAEWSADLLSLYKSYFQECLLIPLQEWFIVKSPQMAERIYRRHEEISPNNVSYVSTSFEQEPTLYYPITAQSVNYRALFNGDELGFLYGIYFIHAKLDGYSIEYKEVDRNVKIGDIKVTETYRGCGIGKHLLNCLETDSRTFGARSIWGTINDEDLGKNPWLPDFCKKNGFSVEENNGFLNIKKAI